MKVTFDSNIWRKVASPDKFPKEPSIQDIRQIKKAIDAGNITAFLCETIFTLEAIQRKGRKDFFADYRPQFTIKENEENGGISLNFSMGPDPTAHPGNNDYLNQHLLDAFNAGFKIVKLPRIAGVTNPDIAAYFYQHEDFEKFHDMACKVGREIEAKNAGIFHVKELGQKYHNQWTRGIEKAPEQETNNIAKAIAEWADGDSVACHIALGGEYFCTRDAAVKAGDKSIFSESNLEWLASTYNFKTITPEELAQKLT